MRRITEYEIIAGQPLQWDVYDERGRLLLRQGSMISSETEAAALAAKGIYVQQQDWASEETAGSTSVSTFPFAIIDDIYAELNSIFGRVSISQRLPSKIMRLCRMLQTASTHDPDACLGAMSLGYYYKYPVMHAIHAALISKAILKRAGWSADERLMPAAAAMTMNISMVELQGTLCHQRTALTDRQKADIKSHPQRSADFLRKCGVTDETWLKTVLQHHELLDGSGYPSALCSNELAAPARAVAIGDIYGARVSGRSYRKPMLPAAALRRMLLTDEKRVDSTLSKILVKNLGLFPPGSLVQLKNGEIAVVTHVGSDARYPRVCSVMSEAGSSLEKPLVRDSSKAEFEIKRALTKNDAAIEINRHKLWGYLQT